MQDPDVGDWIMARATELCSRDVTQLTTRASEGPYFADAQYLRTFLKAVIGKDLPPSGADESAARCQRNPDMGRTLIASMILNLRSRKTNLHGAMNTLMLWDGSKQWAVYQKMLLYLQAGRLASVDNFAQTARTRHHIPPDEALEGILPTDFDQRTFADNAVKHVGQILCDEIAALSSHRNDLPEFFDPHALSAAKTEEYFLPTYDQEESSTRGNMLVIEHYYPGPVLCMPKKFFESRYAFLLGDRLTTARDWAAQDHSQWYNACCDEPDSKYGQECLGFGTADPVGLSTLLSKLPNRKNINLQKIDFYAWLRFMYAVLRALVLRAAMVILKVSTPQGLEKLHLSAAAFEKLCNEIVAQFLLPSLDRLEAEEVKTLPGSTKQEMQCS
ncbi:hypothetical protein B0H10DRAFT_1948033 [Mycena sp. CBHHK59/15]|nr:hypothetical protein B0H10DRAFT_1948033 [Mycena sp. CBHHK59/15]